MSALPNLFRHHPMREVRDRVRIGWARQDVDDLLAEGVDPAVDPLLRSRAERLVTSASRARLAAGLEQIVATADTPAAPLSAAAAVRGARHELMRLAGELRHMPAPRPCGVAMAKALLTDPSSPLLAAASSDEIARAARSAADNMRAAR